MSETKKMNIDLRESGIGGAGKYTEPGVVCILRMRNGRRCCCCCCCCCCLVSSSAAAEIWSVRLSVLVLQRLHQITSLKYENFSKRN